MIVEFDQSFSKSLNRVKDALILKRIERTIIQLEKAPSLSKVSNIRKLTGFKYYYRIRIGDYRLGFEQINSFTVRLIVIAHRKDIYKIFPK
jgi:mRNA interferase RelE/StbE